MIVQLACPEHERRGMKITKVILLKTGRPTQREIPHFTASFLNSIYLHK